MGLSAVGDKGWPWVSASLWQHWGRDCCLATQGVGDLQPLWAEGRDMQLGSILGRCQITAQAVYYSLSLMAPST